MRLDDLRPSENMDDRRGQGGGGFGPRMAFGGGGLGLVAVLAISLLFGVDPRQLLDGGGPIPAQRTERVADGELCKDQDCYFVRQIVGSAEDVWAPLMQERGVRFSPAVTTTYDYMTPTGCGTGQSAAGPFYCPSDGHIYLDLTFFNELGQRFGAPGQFARAYVIAHEYGHHVQNLMGTMEQHGGRERGADSDAVRVELQADCYAGVWANHATTVPGADGQVLITEITETDLANAVQTAGAIGDDYIQTNLAGQRVDPSQFSHGTSAQRQKWLLAGYRSGDPAACNTFDTDDLG